MDEHHTTPSPDAALAGLSRRDALRLLGGAGLAAAAGGTGLAQTATQTPTTAPAQAVLNGSGFYRLRLGEFTVVVLSDGQSAPGPLLPNFGANPERQADFQRTLSENFINPAAVRNNFTPVYVDTGRNKVLLDTGLGPQAQPTAPTGRLLAHLRLAGVNPDDIDTVFITHGHGDHIGGLTNAAGQPAFPRARLVMGETDWNAFTRPAQGEVAANVARNLVALRERFTLIRTGAEIVPGLTTVDSPGHTPGHQSVLIASGQAQMMAFGDAAGHHLLSLHYPDAYLGFDADKALVVQTRARLFERVAAERMLVSAYHFPWPSVGYIRRRAAGGYEFVSAPFEL